MAVDAIGGVAIPAGNLPTSAIVSQQDFLRILLTQLRFQDPLKPADNEEFVAQLAQFSALEINREQSLKIDTLLQIQSTDQSVSLIGKTVQIGDANIPGQASSGTVTAISFRTGTPLLTITLPDKTAVVDVPLSSVTLVR